MAGRTQYVATAPLVIVRDTTGVQHYVYQGGLVVVDVDPDHLESLLAKGMLAEAELVEVAAVSVVTPEFDAVPAKSAPLEVWRRYHVFRGADPEAAATAKKKELVELYFVEPTGITGTADNDAGDLVVVDATGDPDGTQPPTAPAKSADRPTWDQFAVDGHGWDLETAQAVSSKDELIAQLGY